MEEARSVFAGEGAGQPSAEAPTDTQVIEVDF